MSAVIKLVSADPQLVQLVRETGMPCSSSSREALAGARAARREAAGRAGSRSSRAGTADPAGARRAQAQPSGDGRAPGGVEARSGADARSDARRRERVRHRSGHRCRSCRRRSSGWWAISRRVPSGDIFAFIGAKGGVGATTVAVNVATALAKDDPGLDAADRPERGVRRRGGLPRRRAAVFGDGRARERPAARRRVLQRPGRAHQGRPRPAGRVRAAGHRNFDARGSARCSTLPARRTGSRCSTCRGPTPPRSIRSTSPRRSCWS